MQKHLEQQASLIGHMAQCGFLAGDRSFVEFGAGKGKFLHFVSLAVGTDKAAHYIAIDRDNSRFKFDRFHREDEEKARFVRIREDIEHVRLASIAALHEHTDLVVCGKHLCGAATGAFGVHKRVKDMIRPARDNHQSRAWYCVQ